LAGAVKELMLESHRQEAVEAAGEALSVARAAGDEVAELRSLDGLGMALFGLSRHAEGERALREALDRMRAGRHIRVLYTHVNPVDALAGAGRLAEARALVEEGDALAAEKGAPRRWIMLLRPVLAFQAGEWEAAEAALPTPRRPAGARRLESPRATARPPRAPRRAGHRPGRRRDLARRGARGLRPARPAAARARRVFAGTRATCHGCRRRPVRAHAAGAPGAVPARGRPDEP
jgi:hypothetical protein